MVMQKNTTICLAMIVKNEASVIRRCLDSVMPVIDHWVIVDTGSTDGTQQIIRDHLHQLPGTLYERPWRDFAHNRSEALALARTCADYTLIIDADDTLEQSPDFNFRALSADAYAFEIRDPPMLYHRTQLVRNRLNWFYRGVLHEFVMSNEANQTVTAPVGIRRNHDGARRKEPSWFLRDIEVLERALQTEQDPYLVARYSFYLAQSYRDARIPQKAIDCYLRRATLGQWEEEVFFSLYQAGKLMETLNYNDDEVLDVYRRAFSAVPSRIESLHAASRLCRIRQRYEEGFEFAKLGLNKPVPPYAMFVENWIYETGLLDEYAVNAYWIGRYRECREACLRLLSSGKLSPDDDTRVFNNLREAMNREQPSVSDLPRLHVISLPHTETTRQFDWCAFTAKTRKFATMMTQLGYDVRLYSGEVNEAKCTEHIPIVSRAEQAKWFGQYDWSRHMFNDFDSSREFWQVTNARAAREIRARARPGDILGLVMGASQQPIARMLGDMGLHEVEIGIGYSGIVSPFRVFESYALRHFLADRAPNDDVRPFDVVIPNFFELDQFPEGDGSGDYYLFMGRLIRRKGPKIAADVCRQIGAKLVIAGQGMASTAPNFVTSDGTVLEGDIEYVGLADPVQRARLMGEAKAVFVPTIYLEPFGGVAVEAMLCGTPVITSDWGAFTETVIDGVTGFRCHTMSDFVEAAIRAPSLDRKAIRAYATSRYATSVVGKQYDRYFRRLTTDYPAFVEQQKQDKLKALAQQRSQAETQPTFDNWLNLSRDYYNAGLYRETIDAANNALKLNPNSAEAYNNMSVAHKGLREWDLAIKAANTALKFKPDFELAKNNLRAALEEQRLFL
jgi:glycosyltransferase involved in cell wall biosynthesis